MQGQESRLPPTTKCLCLEFLTSLELHMKLDKDSIVNEVFLYQNMYFLYAKIIHRRRRLSERRQNFVN